MTMTKRRLDDYLDDLPPTMAQSSHDDGVPDSSSDTSDIDEPKPLPPPTAAGPSRLHRPDPVTPIAVSGPSRAAYQARPHSILNKAPEKKVEATVGRGGKLQYAVASSPQEGHYFAVQW
jgi:DNA repair and recombination protein RAD54B